MEYLGLSHAGVISTNKSVRGTREPLAKFGTVVATVALRFVPNYSAAIVTKRTQYPIPKPRNMTST